MIENNALGDRLNNFKKNKKDIPTKNLIPKYNEYIFKTFSAISNSAILVARVFIYGYAIKIVFSTDWNFWEVSCVSLAFNFFLTFIYSLFNKKKL